MPAHAAEADLHLARHRAAPYAERADQADHVRRPILQGKRCRLPAAERRKPFSGKHLLADAPPRGCGGPYLGSITASSNATQVRPMCRSGASHGGENRLDTPGKHQLQITC